VAEITQSGLYHDIHGQLFLVTQGLGYTLVDRKKILFRLFLSPFNLAQTTAVCARIKYIGADIPPTEILIPSGDLLIEDSIPNGLSVGIVFQGNIFPDASLRYLVEFYLLAGELSYARFAISELKFQKSGSMRVLVKSLFGTAPWGNKIEPNIGWFIEIGESLNRFAAMLPVSDGIAIQSNPDPDIGLGWFGGQPFDTWPNPCPSGDSPSEPDDRFPNVLRCPGNEINNALIAEAKELKSQGTRVDVTVAWRPRDYTKFPPPGGEGMSGQGMIANGERLATTTGGSISGVYFTASIVAQEVGHTFGLEPKDSPHYDGGSHSTDTQLIDPFAFDFVLLRPYYPPQGGANFLQDVMFPFLSEGMNSILFNAYDWEHLRRELVEISALALKGLNESGGKKKLVGEVQKLFAKLQKIQVQNPESTLSSKPGFEWHWRRNGFQRLVEGKPYRNKSGLAPSAESLLSTLKELGVKEFYAPIDGKPLTIITNTTVHVTCYNNGIRSSGLP
jgi:hypothetical protein